MIGAVERFGFMLAGAGIAVIGYSTVWCKQLRMEALPAFWDVMPVRAKTAIPRAD